MDNKIPLTVSDLRFSITKKHIESESCILATCMFSGKVLRW